MTGFFEGSNIEEPIQHILAHIKTQLENVKLTETEFKLDKILHLYINFHELALSRDRSYAEFPEQIAKNKVVINFINNDEHGFEWTVFVALHDADPQ